MNFLAQIYVSACQQSFSSQGPLTTTAPLSRTERLRVLRAFYRHQIICNAWAPTKRRRSGWTVEDVATISNTSDHQGVPLGLLAPFEAWELQHIDLVNRFVAQLCIALHVFKEDAGQESDSLVGLTTWHWPIDEADFSNIISFSHELTRYLRSHPMLTEAALRSMPSIPGIMKRKFVDDTSAWSLLSERYCIPCLRYAWQAHRFVVYTDPVRDGNSFQQQQQQQADDGEEENRNDATTLFTEDNVNLPPFGWVDAMDGHYVNWFGEALHSEVAKTSYNSPELSLARLDILELWMVTGFALWDKWRVEALKKLDLMKPLHTGWVVD